MLKLRFRLGPIVYEPRYIPDRRKPVGGATRKDAIVITALVVFFLASAILGTVLT